MINPNITKVTSTRNIGFNKTKGLFVEQHNGIDDKGVKWSWLALINPVNGKVIETYDYREQY